MRIRGHAHPNSFTQGKPVQVEVRANGESVGGRELDRAGLFIVEADLPQADEYTIEVAASPEWTAPPDDRVFTLTLSRIRLLPRE